MTATRLPKSNRCPVCDTPLDAATSTDGEDNYPGPGDWTVCLRCAVILVFADDLSVRLPLRRDAAALTPEVTEKLDLVRRALRMIIDKAAGTA